PLTPLHGDAAEMSAKAKLRITADTIEQVIRKKALSVELVTFPETEWNPVKVVRGGSPARGKDGHKLATEKAEHAEIVTFGDPRAQPVRIVRGETGRAAAPAEQPGRGTMNTQMVTFADPRDRPVSIIRGSVSYLPDTGLFGAASAAD